MDLSEMVGAKVTKEYAPDEEFEKPKTGMWDFLNSINHTKKEFDDYDEFNPFMTNRGLSYHSDTVILANEMNRFPGLDKQAQFLFLKTLVRKRKRFGGWVKAKKDINIEMIMEHYNWSRNKAEEAFKLFTKKDLKNLKNEMKKGGKDDK